MTTTAIDSTRPVGLGQVELAHAPAQLTAILGSCVGIAIHDQQTGTGTLAHVVVPHGNDQRQRVVLHAERALDESINMLEEAGCNRENMIAKIAGGATMFGAEELLKRAEENIAVIRRAVQAAKLDLRGEHVGGSKGRRVVFVAQTGDFHIETPGEASLAI